VQEPGQTTSALGAADDVPNVEAADGFAPSSEPVPGATEAPRGPRPRTIGVAGLAGAAAVGALAIAFVAGGGGGNEPAPAAVTDVSSPHSAPIGRVSVWTAPDGASEVRPEHFGRGGMRGVMRGEMGNAITITAIDGSKLALETENGWTRTIDATGATVTKDGEAAAVADLEVGDTIVFRETRNADGTYTTTAIVVVQPHVAGTVASVSGSTVTVTGRDGSTSKVVLTSSTTYQLAGEAATKDAVVAGSQIVARGTLASDGTLTASSVDVAPAGSAGTVKEKGTSSLTLTTRDGSTVVVKVTSSTTYQVAGVSSPTLADIDVGDVVMASGTRNADGSLSATIVRSHAAGELGGPGGPGGMPGDGFGRGGMRGGGPGWGFPDDSDTEAAPSTAPSGTSG
jgi:hypothetical protein